MSEHSPSYWFGIAFALMLGIPRPLQAATLTAYLKSATTRAYQVQLSRGDLETARAAQRKALAGILPALAASASYARNQYDAQVTLPSARGAGKVITITPQNAWDASVNLTVPLVDGHAWERLSAANHGQDAADAQLAADLNDVLMQVVQDYYDALYSEQVEGSAQRSLEAAQGTLQRTEVRREAGLATALQQRRSEADVGRALQALADAQVSRAAAMRNLATLSGLREAPSPADAQRGGDVADALAQALAMRPEVTAARAQVEQAEASTRETYWDYAPQLVGKASERYTNATGFSGQNFLWQAGVALQWNLFDSGGREATVRDAATREAQARVRLEQTLQRVRDEVADAEARLTAAKTKLAAAQQEVASAHEAMRLAVEEQDAGSATALDVTVALRDMFVADVSLARAVADVAVAGESLRHAAGLPLWTEAS